MAVNFTNFLNAPQDSGFGDAFSKSMQTYQNLNQMQAQNRQNRLGEEFDRPLAEAELTRKLMEARVAGLSPDQRAVIGLTEGEFSPEQKKLLANQMGVRTDEEGKLKSTPEGTIDLRGMGVNAANKLLDKQDEQLRAIQPAKIMYHNLEEINRIIGSRPNLDRSAAYILSGGDPDSKKQRALRSRLNRQDLAALEMVEKLSSDIVTQLSQSMGSKGATDFMAKTFKASKPGVGMTDEAILYASNHLMDVLRPQIEKQDKIIEAMQGGYYDPRLSVQNYDFEKALKTNKPPPRNMEERVSVEMKDGPVTEEVTDEVAVLINGKKYRIPQDKVDAALKKYPNSRVVANG